MIDCLASAVFMRYVALRYYLVIVHYLSVSVSFFYFYLHGK